MKDGRRTPEQKKARLEQKKIRRSEDLKAEKDRLVALYGPDILNDKGQVKPGSEFKTANANRIAAAKLKELAELVEEHGPGILDDDGKVLYGLRLTEAAKNHFVSRNFHPDGETFERAIAICELRVEEHNNDGRDHPQWTEGALAWLESIAWYNPKTGLFHLYWCWFCLSPRTSGGLDSIDAQCAREHKYAWYNRGPCCRICNRLMNALPYKMVQSKTAAVVKHLKLDLMDYDEGEIDFLGRPL